MAESLASSAFNLTEGNQSIEKSHQEPPKKSEKETLECAVCLQTCMHPAKLPCGHIFCFLCIKGVAYKNRRCPICRRDIPAQFIDHPHLVFDNFNEMNNGSTEDGYQWFYEGRNGWWQYDERTSQDIEDAYKRGDKFCTILVAGYVYVVDFETMLQQRQNDPSRRRQVKRDLATIPKKGVAGLRIDDDVQLVSVTNATNVTGQQSITASPHDNIVNAIAATDTAVRIAHNIIDSTLVGADDTDESDIDFILIDDSDTETDARPTGILNEVQEALDIQNMSSINTSNIFTQFSLMNLVADIASSSSSSSDSSDYDESGYDETPRIRSSSPTIIL